MFSLLHFSRWWSINCVLSHVTLQRIKSYVTTTRYKLIKNSIIQLKMHEAILVLSEALLQIKIYKTIIIRCPWIFYNALLKDYTSIDAKLMTLVKVQLRIQFSAHRSGVDCECVSAFNQLCRRSLLINKLKSENGDNLKLISNCLILPMYNFVLLKSRLFSRPTK